MDPEIYSRANGSASDSHQTGTMRERVERDLLLAVENSPLWAG
jgi:hypothetical protein